MVLPDRVVEIAHGTAFFELGTRDDKLRPFAVTAFGGKVGAGRDTVTCFIPEPAAQRVEADLKANGRVALTIGEPVSHESYQLKGGFRDLRPATDADLAVVGLWGEKVTGWMRSYGLPDSFFAGLAFPPLLALTFAVEELFAQTPGPGAGAKVS